MTVNPALELTTCRTCGASIFFAASGTTGSRIPFDAEPSPNGTHCIYRFSGGLKAYPAGIEQPSTEPREHYVSHFATCPDAELHRKPPKPAAPKAEQLSLLE